MRALPCGIQIRMRKAVLDLFDNLFGIAVLVKGDAVFALIHRAGRDQTGAGRRIFADDDRWPKGKTFAQPVRFLTDDPADLEVQRAQPEGVAGANVQTFSRALRQPCLAGEGAPAFRPSASVKVP